MKRICLLWALTMVAAITVSSQRRIQVVQTTATDPVESKRPVLVTIGPSSVLLDGVATTRERLPKQLAATMKTKFPGDEIVYITSRGETKYKDIVGLIKLGRPAEIDDYGLIVGENAGPADAEKAIKIKISIEPVSPKGFKANARILLVELGKDGKITLGSKPLADKDALVRRLTDIFAERTRTHVYFEGSREIDTTVWVNISRSASFRDAAEVIETVRKSGSTLIALDIDSIFP